MEFKEDFDFNGFIGKHTLLYGEVDTKKTYATAKFVQFLVEVKEITPKDITILDFAPPLKLIGDLKIGGKIEDYYETSHICNNITFSGKIIPPRLKSQNSEELNENAYKNFQKTQRILKDFENNPTSILIVNDISIYLHLGSRKYLLKLIDKTETFLGNSYSGNLITTEYASDFNLKEKEDVEYLIRKIQNSYKTK